MTGQVIVDISMSLDGYVTGPGADQQHGLGVGGEPLHDWVFDQAPLNRKTLDDMLARTGAVIMGRRTFDVVDGPDGWNDEVGYGAERERTVAPPPVFVLTHAAPETWRLGDRFTFVTDGPHSAVAKARAAAGAKDVVIMGGGQICHAFLAAGLVDLLDIHLAPIVLGAGTRLFPVEDSPRVRLELVESVSAPSAEHLSYKVIAER
ncbi:dihydrofolate reductase family protein [Actinokineospora xionganensis]|uniref:Dihydrofolate reductase family protein n=1 Tax=Actinokineospora xionganensis TaxID=2684470 RepID=A0ABR7LFA8_9PSEU|nr:dihydrofolate reductase family protein [Actinokineospora xionganensis]MBC6451041.1 dihydrofolate reductase family protein [Actinokineospora xionganensis]